MESGARTLYDSEEQDTPDIDPKLKKAKSSIVKLLKQLVETKLEIEESNILLKSERTMPGWNVARPLTMTI